MARFNTMADVKKANEQAGEHWFSPETMRFFGSRVGSELHTGPGGQYFVSSERPRWEGAQRAYTVRRVNPDATIDTHGEFMAHETVGRARTAARHAAAEDPGLFRDRRGY